MTKAREDEKYEDYQVNDIKPYKSEIFEKETPKNRSINLSSHEYESESEEEIPVVYKPTSNSKYPIEQLNPQRVIKRTDSSKAETEA